IAYINEQLGGIGGLFGEEIAFQGVVDVSMSANEEMKPRILVVGRYKSLIIKKQRASSRDLVTSVHHYDLIEIAEPPISQTPISSMFIRSPDRKVENIVIKSIVFTTFTISRGFPQEALVQVTLPPNRYQPLQFNHDFGPDGKGIAEQYIAHSHYFKRKATLDFLRHMETLYLTRYPELDLSQIPGVDPTCSLGFNLFTSIICLRHNPFIRSLRINKVPHINVISSVAEMLYTNRAISELTITNLLSEQPFTPLGVALQHIGTHSALQRLNLSNNTLSYESLVSLADGLAAFNHSLIELNLSECNIPPKGCSQLVQALERNFAMSLTLETLNLSGNRFQDTGSSALVSWLCKIRGVHALRELRLSACQLNFSTLAASLRALEGIELIDFSKNKITLISARMLASETIGCFRQLRHLDLSGCGLVGDSLQTIFTAFIVNKKLPRNSMTLNLASNGLAGKSGQILADLLNESMFLNGLDISENSLATKQLTDIMTTLNNLPDLASLNVGYNSTSVNDEAFIAGIVDFVGRHSKLTKLGVGQHYNLGAALNPLIQMLNNNKSLTALDITGNEMNDHGACLLADCFRNNKSLQKVYLSGNKFTFVGWQSIASPFIYYRNTTLTKLELPKPSDLIMVSDANTNILTAERRLQLDITFQTIKMHLELNRNRVSAASRFNYLPSCDPPLYVRPPASVPEHLSSTPIVPTSRVPLRESGTSDATGQPHKIQLPSIFAKPINSVTKPINSLLHMADIKEIPEIGYAPSRRTASPNTWNDDDWKSRDSGRDEKD
ncbi:hypothetical protein SAMD00019534_016020, partial [Acytostelium subglobosum LB1]|uniref:hypothetical protein n=1 Tax=Acytostelium subglobosum LB1 TaxID=1410327 RepID=UPI000644C29D